LITVPACLECNKSFERDDEYFRDCAALEQRSSRHPDAERVMGQVLRGLQKPRRRGYSQYFLSRVGTLQLRSAAGLYLGNRGGLNVDLERLGRTAARIVRGLYYHEFAEVLPLSYQATAFFPEGFAHLPTWDVDRIRHEVVEPTLRNNRRAVGRGVLHYWVARASDNPLVTSWILEFYRGVRCAVAVVPSPSRDA
jgi:hypothetical protein